MLLIKTNMENQHIDAGIEHVIKISTEVLYFWTTRKRMETREQQIIVLFTSKVNLPFTGQGTFLRELLQVVRVASQLEDERGSSDLLLDVLIQKVHILIDAVDVCHFVQLKGN